jgi:hypothetical protein
LPTHKPVLWQHRACERPAIWAASPRSTAGGVHATGGEEPASVLPMHMPTV